MKAVEMPCLSTTPEPAETLELVAPQPPRTSNRQIRAPATLAQEQEKEAAGKIKRRQKRSQPETGPRGSSTSGHVASTPDNQTDAILRMTLDASTKTKNSNKYLY
jgi:hypothetical protein